MATPGKMPTVDDAKPLLARLMTHQGAHTLEHIEKQQRSVTPQNLPVNSTPMPTSILNRSKKKCAKTPGENVTTTQDKANANTSHSDANGSSSFLRIPSPVACPLPTRMSQNTVTNSIPLSSLFAHSTSDGNTVIFAFRAELKGETFWIQIFGG